MLWYILCYVWKIYKYIISKTENYKSEEKKILDNKMAC
jgi:hypothetical protein